MRELFLELVGDDNFATESQQRNELYSLIEQAYPDGSAEEKERARKSLEIVLGVEWSESISTRHSLLSLDGNLHHVTNHERKVPIKVTNTSSGTISRLDPSTKDSPLNTHRKHLQHNNNGDPFLRNQGIIISKHISYQQPISPPTIASNTDEERSSKLHRSSGDMVFYKVLSVLLRLNRISVMVIEDAHFGDELSWNELHMLLTGKEMKLVVLLTTRSNAALKSMSGEGSTTSSPSHNISRSPSTRKQSIYSVSHSEHHHGDNIMIQDDSSKNNGLKYSTNSAAYMSIFGHEKSTVIEMTNLAFEEVQEILIKTLKIQEISSNLVKLVQEVSCGNAYWCNEIAHFIQERGVNEFEKTATLDKNGCSSSCRPNALKQLILLRMEKLSVDAQLILKHASIIGSEFSETMLQTIIPDRLKHIMSSCLKLLVEFGFVSCIEDSPEVVFEFENHFIQQTVFELIPPR
jgi:hypothetical protein